jgi:hypothetical protein
MASAGCIPEQSQRLQRGMICTRRRDLNDAVERRAAVPRRFALALPVFDESARSLEAAPAFADQEPTAHRWITRLLSGGVVAE